MKKNLLFILGMLIALPGFAGRTFTYEYEGHTLKYEVLDEESKTCQTAPGNSDNAGNSVGGNLILPSHPEDENGVKYTLTTIGERGFDFCRALKSVSIPETVTHIDKNAFGLCSMEYVNFASLESILNMWYGVSGEDSSENGSQPINWSKKLYIDGEEVTEIVIPDGVKEIGGYVGGSIFDNGPKWQRYAFFGARSITSVKLPETLTSIGGYTFCNTSIEELTLPETLTSIGAHSFENTKIKELTFPEMLTSIGGYSFYQTNVKGLIIPESVQYIGYGAFGKCAGLIDVMLLSKECEIEDSAFSDCSNLLKVAAYNTDFLDTFSDNISKWTIIEGETVDAKKGIIWADPSNPNPYPWVSTKYSGKLELPEGVTSLYWYCMAKCSDITEVVLPESLETIGATAFYQCSGLEKILIPNSVKTIGKSAFYQCTSLKEIILPESLETIPEGAFNQCSSLEEILIPTKVTEVGQYAFYSTKLQKAGYPDAISNPFGEDVLAIEYDAYNSKIENGCVYSRRNDMLYYVPITVGPDFVVPDGVTEITDDAFAFCEGLTTLTLPNTVTTLGKRVWNGCNALKSVTCYVTEPISAERDIFPVDAYDSATLYVPTESLSAYEKTKPWSYFYDIKSVEASGVETVPAIEDVAIDFTLPYDVFNLNGVKIADSTDNLPAGIYILRQGNAVKKIAVK